MKRFLKGAAAIVGFWALCMLIVVVFATYPAVLLMIAGIVAFCVISFLIFDIATIE